jgi:hypothetical protein
MTRNRQIRLAACVVAAVATLGCDQSPTASSPHAVAQGHPTPVAQLRGGSHVLGGNDADTLVRHLAARWAADGNHTLQTYVDTAAFWDGPTPQAPSAPEPRRLIGGAGPGPDFSGLVAVVNNPSSTPSVNGTQGVVVATSGYIGTDASMTLRYGARFTQGGGDDIPVQIASFADGHAIQKMLCGTEIIGGMLVPPDCYGWSGVVRGSAQLYLSHDCGEAVHSSQTTRAWYELPLPLISVSTSGNLGATFTWKHFGDSGPAATPDVSALQPACPQKVVTEPVCGTEILSEPGSCNPDGADPTLPPPPDAGDNNCQLYLVRWMISYDGGRTWQTTSSHIENRC